MPQAIVANDVILDTKRLFEIGNEAGAADYVVQELSPYGVPRPLSVG